MILLVFSALYIEVAMHMQFFTVWLRKWCQLFALRIKALMPVVNKQRVLVRVSYATAVWILNRFSPILLLLINISKATHSNLTHLSFLDPVSSLRTGCTETELLRCKWRCVYWIDTEINIEHAVTFLDLLRWYLWNREVCTSFSFHQRVSSYNFV